MERNIESIDGWCSVTIRTFQLHPTLNGRQTTNTECLIYSKLNGMLLGPSSCSYWYIEIDYVKEFGRMHIAHSP